MAFRSMATALAVKVQSAYGAAATISTATDLLPCFNLRPSNESWTRENPEYTGTIHKRGDEILGRAGSVTFDIAMRGPGGATPPIADAWVPGRIFRAAHFTEISQVAPLLAAAALGAGSTVTELTMPTTASVVDDAYTGLPIQVVAFGTGAKSLTMCRKYVGSTKKALLMETAGTIPTGNVSVPAFLGYRFNATAPQLYLTLHYWKDKKLYKIINGIVSQFQLNMQTSARGDTAICSATITIQGDIDPVDDEVDQTAPTVTPPSQIPPLNDADAWLSAKQVCGSSFTYDQGIQVDFAPCPNGANGTEAPEIVETRRSVQMTVNETLLSDRDWNAMAEAGAYHGLWIQWGKTSGNTISFGVTDGRLNYSSVEDSGNIVTRSPDLLIDGAEKVINIMFPYY